MVSVSSSTKRGSGGSSCSFGVPPKRQNYHDR